MIIGFDGSRAFQEDRTGTENYSYQLLKALAKIDRKNKYLVYIRPHPVILNPPLAGEGSLARLAESAKRANASYSETSSEILRYAQNDREAWPQNFQFKIINWPRLWTQGGLAIQTFKDPLDVLFVPAHTLPLIRRPGLKTVVTIHDLGSEYLPSMHQVKQRLYLGFIQRFQLQTATKIIAVSKATKEDLVKKLGIAPEKIKVIYEGYDKSLFKQVKGDILVNSLIHYNLQPKAYYLFVGTVQPRKNLERLIKAYYSVILNPPLAGEGSLANASISETSSEILRYAQNDIRETDNDEIKLVIAGSKGWLSDEIYKLPKKLGIEDRVKFLGYVPDKDLPALYSGAAALTFPSLFEGFGLPILEAQACGCPVLTSNVSSMPEVACASPMASARRAGKGAVYVNPYNVDDIVKGMIRIQNSEFRIQNIKAGFENIKRFSWEKCARETLKALEGT